MKKLFWLLLVLTLALCLPAAADSIQLTGVGGNNQGGVFTVPYFLSINGGTSISAMCDDFVHDVAIHQIWQGTIFHYADLNTSTLAMTRAGASGITDLAVAQRDYKELFWLYSQYLATPANANNINFAAWAIFYPTQSMASSGWTTGPNSAAFWLAQAQSNYGNVKNLADFTIISPNDLSSTGPQEYIAVPEPSSIMLMASGLAAAYWRRKSSTSIR